MAISRFVAQYRKQNRYDLVNEIFQLGMRLVFPIAVVLTKADKLSRNQMLQAAVNIKKAYTDGVIGFGTKDIKFFARSSSYTANEIVVSETKGLFGKFVPKEGIEFVPLQEDPDVVRAAIAWYARDF